MELIVNISDMRVTGRARDVLVTHSLGSCLGLAAYDPVAKVAGLIHCLLPVMPKNKPRTNPYMFVNTGVAAMMRSMFNHKAEKKNLILKAAGCGRMMNISNKFDTGANNFEALTRLLKINELELAARETGGTKPRTMRLFADTGKVLISSLGETWEL
jgi:chemotaxis protein CheD